jgi:hypothetical protein
MAQGAGYTFNPATVTGTTVRDMAGYFLNGTIVGSAALDAGGKYGQGLHCTGGAMRVVVPADTYPVDTSGGLTMAAWVKLDDNTAAARCIASAASGSGVDVRLYASNSAGNVEARIEGATFSTTKSIRDGAHHHVMVVVDRLFGPGSESVRIVVDGVAELTSTGLTTGLGYSGDVTMEVGRNALGAVEPLFGIVDDFRWWNDPVELAAWPGIIAAEQTDFQLGIYPLDTNANDVSIYNRGIAVAPSASFVPGMYGRGLVSGAAAAGASGTIALPDCDRLSLTGWIRVDTLPTVTAAPILAITDASGNIRMRTVVNTNGTITSTWTTINYGTLSVTSTGAVTPGVWARIQVSMNPTYIAIRLNSTTEQQTSTGNSTPHLSPTVDGLNRLYIGGDAVAGGQCTWNYLTLTKNFINDMTLYWGGPPAVTPYAPANVPRGVYAANENTGTAVNDRSPSHNNLALTGAGSWVTGVQGSAIGSNGTGPGANKTSGLAWDASPKGWAFSGWFKCRSGSSGARILVWRNSTKDCAHAFFLANAFQVRLFDAAGDTGIQSPNGSAVTAETWTHLAASCDGATIRFFKAGIYYGSVAYSRGALLAPNQLYVGGDQPDGAVADVDDLVMFDTPISPGNVAWLFANPGKYYAPVAQFAGWGVPL